MTVHDATITEARESVLRKAGGGSIAVRLQEIAASDVSERWQVLDRMDATALRDLATTASSTHDRSLVRLVLDEAGWVPDETDPPVRRVDRECTRVTVDVPNALRRQIEGGCVEHGSTVVMLLQRALRDAPPIPEPFRKGDEVRHARGEAVGVVQVDEFTTDGDVFAVVLWKHDDKPSVWPTRDLRHHEAKS